MDMFCLHFQVNCIFKQSLMFFIILSISINLVNWCQLSYFFLFDHLFDRKQTLLWRESPSPRPAKNSSTLQSLSGTWESRFSSGNRRLNRFDCSRSWTLSTRMCGCTWLLYTCVWVLCSLSLPAWRPMSGATPTLAIKRKTSLRTSFLFSIVCG